MVLADALDTLGQVASLVAAIAALVTIYFAKKTVSEAKHARAEASSAHSEQMAEARRLLEATAAAHQTEMAARERDAESERVVQRLVQLSAITDVLTEITDIAREEQAHPPVRNEANQPMSRVPSRLSRLRAALSIYERFDGPFMNNASQLANMGYNSGTSLMQVLGMAQSGLGEAIAQADAHVLLEPPALKPLL